jgi:hypothetical protein
MAASVPLFFKLSSICVEGSVLPVFASGAREQENITQQQQNVFFIIYPCAMFSC